jgi:Ca2+-binding RTX toxin-like protein
VYDDVLTVSVNRGGMTFYSQNFNLYNANGTVAVSALSFSGGDGNDFLYGGGGDDALLGGDDDDLLRGGTDNDMVLGGNGHDTVCGDEGNDILSGGDGTYSPTEGFRLGAISDWNFDELWGGEGNDTFWVADKKFPWLWLDSAEDAAAGDTVNEEGWLSFNGTVPTFDFGHLKGKK